MPLTHIHHVIPKHMGGSDDPSNLVELTVEDHAIAHKVLYSIYGKEQDRIAWLCLSGKIATEEANRLALAESNRKRIWTPEARAKVAASRKGKKLSQESKDKVSKANKGKQYTLGKKLSKEFCQKMSKKQKGDGNSFYGKTHSEESRAKMRNRMIGKKKVYKDDGSWTWA